MHEVESQSVADFLFEGIGQRTKSGGLEGVKRDILSPDWVGEQIAELRELTSAKVGSL